MDDTIAQELMNDLRATRAKLDAAQEDAASLKVLLALRTHQHDLAWQARQRLEAELAGLRASAATAPDAADPSKEAASAQADGAAALACAEERFAAAKLVLGAVLASIGRRALDRRRFKALIAEAGREAPDSGPGAARHAVLLSEARRVLGIAG